jgi:1-acyl-sn-glycerol-3-phosphate acyltransferase
VETVLAAIAGVLLRLLGWQVVGQMPPDKHFIVIIAPHTSNWDFVIALAWGFHWRLMHKTAWFGKHSLFAGPWAGLLKRMGGIPIDRAKAHQVVTATIAALRQREEMILALTPEGTRRHTDHWKSGFYRIALRTGIPVGFAFVDYEGKRVGMGPTVRFSGDEEEDWRLIRQFYRREWARHPQSFGEIHLRQEAEDEEPVNKSR